MPPRRIVLLLWVILSASMVAARAAAVIPMPKEMRISSAAPAFTLAADTVLVAHPDARDDAQLFADMVQPATGYDLTVASARAVARVRRRFHLCGRRADGNCRNWIQLARTRDRRMGDEGYALDARPGGIVIRARTPAGWFYGLQTLRQLLPPAIVAETLQAGTSWTVPATRITDAPRFPWRGLMLDSARHFFPRATVERLLDLMALHKLNRLHWHLSDDQGWRLEIRAYPNLTVAGALRAESPVRPLAHGGFFNFFIGGLGTWLAGFDGMPYGGHYTQDDVRAVVAYAAARHIVVVPELDMPGHIQAAIAAYPALGVDGEPAQVSTHWGLPTYILDPADETFTFIDTVMDEVTELFPSPFVHIGGDEVPLTQWQQSPAVQARIAALGVGDEAGLKAWFVDRVAQIVLAHGRRPIGWNEALHDGLPTEMAITSWLGVQPGIDAARQGHDVVMAPTNRTYFDYAQDLPLPPAEQSQLDGLALPDALFQGFLVTLAETYEFDPVAPSMTPAEAAHVLGGQGQLWSEFIHDQVDLDRQAFPRACALAEVLWSPATGRDFPSFQRRLAEHLPRLAARGVGYFGAN